MEHADSIIKGVAIAVLLSTMSDFRRGLKDPKWWIAMMALNVMVNV